MVLWAAAVWLVLGGTYLFLAGEVSTVEVAAGIVATSVGTALAVGLARVADRRLRLRAPPAALLRPLAALCPETLLVGRRLVAAILAPADRHGAFLRQPFEPGPDDDAATAGRRALVVLGLSLAPRSFVIRGERFETIILHALPPKTAAPDRRWPA